MGMARHAPSDTYARKRDICSHAILRLRERLGEGNELRHLPDWDLGNRIDAVVDGAIEQGEDVLDRNELTRIVDLGDAFKERLWAVVRVAHGSRGEAIKTLLTRDIVEANLAKGNWRPVASGSLARILKEGIAPSAKIGDKIVDLEQIRAALPPRNWPARPGTRPEPKPEPLSTWPTASGLRSASPKPAPPKPTPPKPPPPTPPKQELVETRLVSYQTADGSPRYAEYAKDDVSRALSELLSDSRVNHATVRVWREVKTRIRFEVDE